MLRRALELVSFDYRKDRLIGLGDLIDRGPDSRRLLLLLRDEPWFVSVRGNHEAMLRSVVRDDGPREIWDQNGNEWSYGLDHGDLKPLADIVDGMPIAAELNLADGRRIGLVHAEVRLGASWDDLGRLGGAFARKLTLSQRSTAIAALWGRTRAAAMVRVSKNPSATGVNPMTRTSTWDALLPVSGIDKIVSGHNVVERIPVIYSNHLLIDTGAYLPRGRLTITHLESGSFWQVSGGRYGGRAVRTKPMALPTATLVDTRWRPDDQSRHVASRAENLNLDFLDRRPF